ncbi:MAG: hypothetical protein LC099_06575 [Anaerolineales bacterium]|nr:hypothetical protein [Anaerolineales bacterium]
MDAKQINQTTDLLDFVGYELRKAGGYHVGACPFCGGRDRFTVKHTAGGDRWHCRICGDGKYHTVIDYVMRRDNCDFKAALITLGGAIQRRERAEVPIGTVAKHAPKPLQMPDDQWQADAWREVDAASDALHQPQGQAARAWLLERGISRAMWDLYQLGFMVYSPKDKPTVKIPVITIPWYDMDASGEAVMAVKYRVLRKDSKLRYFSKAGSKYDFPFGLFDAMPFDTLIFVEGELNCISARQCEPRGLSVLSFGSEGGGDNRALKAIASRYKSVYVWADDLWDNPKQAQRAKELRTLICGKGRALRSVKDSGIKQDANQLLQSGALPEFLSRVVGVDCQQAIYKQR